MSWVPAQHVIQAISTQRAVLDEQDARMRAAEQAHATERQRIQADGIAAANDLAHAVLPALDAASIARAASAVGLPGLAREDIPGHVEARRAWLVARLQTIARDPRYANAELLRHPRTGTLVTALAEATDMRSAPAEVVEKCARHPRFERLVEVGYGTPEDKGSWWRYSHWVDRSAANEILERFPGKTTFAEVLEEYRRAAEAVSTYDADIARLRAEIEAGEALEREYTALWNEHQNLDAQALEHTRGRIVQHMLTADASLLSQRLVSWADVRLLFLRTSGLAAKLGYLDAIQHAHLEEMRRDVAAQREKLDAVQQRTQRRWAPMPWDKYEKLVVDRRPRYDKRWQRFGKVYTQVAAFDRWDRGRRFDQLLWWDVMTRGRYDGSYIPEVASFHESHPTYVFDAELLRGHGAGIAEADPDLGLVDVSDAQDEAEAAALAADDALDPDAGAGLAVADAS